MPAMIRNFLFCASADSQLKYGYPIAKAFADRGWNLYCAIDVSQKHINERQFQELGIECPVRLIDPLQALDAGFMDTFDAIYFQSVGTSMWTFFQAAQARVVLRKLRARPIIITGYVGLVIEKHLEGLLWRQGADFIAVNSAHDYEIFSRYTTELGLDQRALVRTGFPFARQLAQPRQSDGERTILFAAQPTVPGKLEHRLYILGQLVDLARQRPDYRILIKRRTLPGENQFHVEKHHYEQLLASQSGMIIPPNLQFYYGTLAEILPNVDVLATVSSTAAMEALACGIPVLIISDFGIGESLGNHLFAGSGLAGPLTSLLRDEFPTADPVWLERNGLAKDDRIENLVNAVEDRLREQEAMGQPYASPSVFFSRDTAPYLHRIFAKSAFAAAKVNAPAPSKEAKPAAKAAKPAAKAAKPKAAPKPLAKPTTVVAPPVMARERGSTGRLFRKARKLLLHPQQFFADMKV